MILPSTDRTEIKRVVAVNGATQVEVSFCVAGEQAPLYELRIYGADPRAVRGSENLDKVREAIEEVLALGVQTLGKESRE